MDRKNILSCAAALTMLALPSAASDTVSGDGGRYTLRYDQPVPDGGAMIRELHNGGPYDRDWEYRSLPIGNGYMGANIFGRTDTERIQISEKTLAVKGPYGLSSFTNFAEIYLDFNHRHPADY